MSEYESKVFDLLRTMPIIEWWSWSYQEFRIDDNVRASNKEAFLSAIQLFVNSEEYDKADYVIEVNDAKTKIRKIKR